jgi:hypothetical protein
VLPGAPPVRFRGAISDVIYADIWGQDVLLLLGVFLKDALRQECLDSFIALVWSINLSPFNCEVGNFIEPCLKGRMQYC